VDGQCGAPSLSLAGVVSLLGGRVLVEQNDDSVIVALIEDFGRVHNAVS
jgi:hypothetical protein